MALKLRAGALLAGACYLGLVGFVAYHPQLAQSLEGGDVRSNARKRISNAPEATTKMQMEKAESLEGAKDKNAVSSVSLDGDYCDPFEPVNVASLTQQSDLIVVGRIEQVKGPRYLEIAHHMQDPHNQVVNIPLEQLKAQMFYVIDCDRVIKGDQTLAGKKLKWVDPNWYQNIHVDSANGVTYRDEIKNGIPQLNYGIFFLKKDGSNLKFADKNHCVLPASPAPMVVAPDISKAIVDELIHVLNTPLDLLNTKGGALGGESGTGTEGRYSLSAGEVLMRDAITVLNQLPPESWKKQLSQLTTGDYPPLTKLWAFAALAGTNDWSCFPNVENFLLNPPEELHYVASYPFRLLKDKSQTAAQPLILSSLPTSEIIASLKSTDANIRGAASFLLAGKKDPQLAEVLMRAAGNDKDETVRENSRSGLSELTNIGSEVWQKEPALAEKIALGKSTIALFGASMLKGNIFDQGKCTEEVNARLSANLSDLSHLPDWVMRAISWIESESKSDQHLGLEHFLPAETPKGWSWEGSEDSHGHRQAWYTFRGRTEPAAESNDELVIRNTTVALLVDLKGGQYPEMSANLTLPPLTILDAWQQDDDIIFKRLSKDRVRLLRLTRIYGSDGTRRKVSPSGIEQICSVRDIQAK